VWCATFENSDRDTLSAAFNAMQKEIDDIGLYPGRLEVHAVLAQSPYAVSNTLVDCPAYGLEINPTPADIITSKGTVDNPKQLELDYAALRKLVANAKIDTYAQPEEEEFFRKYDFPSDPDRRCFKSAEYFGKLYPSHEQRLHHLEKIREKLKRAELKDNFFQDNVELVKWVMNEKHGSKLTVDPNALERLSDRGDEDKKEKRCFHKALKERRKDYVERVQAIRKMRWEKPER
jgi:hypothetical protein